MDHRHINATQYTPAVIDDIISRGDWSDWMAMGKEMLCDVELQKTIQSVAMRYVDDPYEQRYHAWLNFIKKQTENKDEAVQTPKLG